MLQSMHAEKLFITPRSLGNNEVYPDECLLLDYHADEKLRTREDRCSNLGNIWRPARLFYFVYLAINDTIRVFWRQSA